MRHQLWLTETLYHLERWKRFSCFIMTRWTQTKPVHRHRCRVGAAFRSSWQTLNRLLILHHFQSVAPPLHLFSSSSHTEPFKLVWVADRSPCRTAALSLSELEVWLHQQVSGSDIFHRQSDTFREKSHLFLFLNSKYFGKYSWSYNLNIHHLWGSTRFWTCSSFIVAFVEMTKWPLTSSWWDLFIVSVCELFYAPVCHVPGFLCTENSPLRPAGATIPSKLNSSSTDL